MPQFEYVVKNRTGKKVTGKLVVETKRVAYERLRDKGFRILEINEQKETVLNRQIQLFNPVSSKDFVIFLRQFTTIIRAGVTVIDGLNILVKQTNNKSLQNALQQIEDDVREGNTFSDACEKFPKIFPMMFVNLIRAGEVSGTLDDTLDRLAVYYEKQNRSRQKIVSALTYPATIAVFAVAVVIVLLVKVVPTFVELFQNANAKLPAITLFVLNLSKWMESYWWLVVGGILGVIAFLRMMKSKPATKYYVDYFVLRLPVVGKLLQKFNIARMMRTMSSLMAASVPILQSLSIVEKVLNNEVLARVLMDSRKDVENGLSMTQAMEEHWSFPPLVTQMIIVGENTGSLDEMLGKIADFYEAEVDTATDQFKALIEPVMIIVLAGLVGTILASIMVPMFQIFNTIK